MAKKNISLPWNTRIIPGMDTFEDICKWLNNICDHESEYSDLELSNKLDEVYKFRLGGNDGKSTLLFQHNRSDMIVKKRAKKYCRRNKIKLEDYKGPLPYRVFIIDTFPNESRFRKEKLEKIKKKMFNNKIRRRWKNIFGVV